MSEELLQKLRLLEEDYLGQPAIVQQADLPEINQLRSQLGMPLVDAHLKEIGGGVENDNKQVATSPEPKVEVDHSAARAIYQAYLKKLDELKVYQEYAQRVAEATAGRGQTPVRPLATMGTGGGPLLCDHCGKPIVLEGGNFHGQTADVAWQKSPNNDWKSWILGGMVVEIQVNGTLRIYHGYPGRDSRYCCNIANRQSEDARAAHDNSLRTQQRPLLRAFIEHEFPDMTKDQQFELLSQILDTMYGYDPGLGVNRPG